MGILALTEAEDRPSAVKQFLTKWGEKGKNALVKLIKWLIATLAGSLIAYYCEPIFKVTLPSVFLLEEDTGTANRVEIPVNTEIHVWNEVTNNFIEITYTVDGEEQMTLAGYDVYRFGGKELHDASIGKTKIRNFFKMLFEKYQVTT